MSSTAEIEKLEELLEHVKKECEKHLADKSFSQAQQLYNTWIEKHQEILSLPCNKVSQNELMNSKFLSTFVYYEAKMNDLLEF